MIKKECFLEKLSEVSRKHLDGGESETKMTVNFSDDQDLAEFSRYVAQTAWNILFSQGYDMDRMTTYISEMWTQEHNYMSSMDTHLHGHGAQISAFYFLDTPKNGCGLVIHDPRVAKVITNLPEKEPNKISLGSSQVVFSPEAGMLILTNSWLPHSFTRNMSHEPTRFVHINISVAPLLGSDRTEVEIV
jgi:uncharacterized protein (TIGR02466 family)